MKLRATLRWLPAALALLPACGNRGAPTADGATTGQASAAAPSSATPSASAGVATAPACDTPEACARAARALDAAEGAREAMKRMNKEDGKGCLAALDGAARADAAAEAQYAMTRGQCEMLVGQCQAGKKRIDKYLDEMSNQPPESRLKTVEGMASMWCRGGDMTPRDQLLQGLYELQQGAYITRKEPDFCHARLDSIKKLLPSVPARDADDSQVKSAPDAVYVMAATCLGRAGDCDAAWRVYQGFPPIARELSKSPGDPARKEIARKAFEAAVPACVGK